MATDPSSGGEGISDGSAGGGGGRSGAGRLRQWSDVHSRRKEPSMYDEWLNSERPAQQQLQTITSTTTTSSSSSQPQTPRRGSMPLRQSGAGAGGDTSAFITGSASYNSTTTSTFGQLSASTIRSVTPGHSGDESNGRSSPGFELPSSPTTTTTTATTSKPPSNPASPTGNPERRRRLLIKGPKRDKDKSKSKDKSKGDSTPTPKSTTTEDWDHEAHRIQSHSPPSSRNGSSASSAAVMGTMLARNGSSSRGHGHAKRASTLGGSADRTERRLAAAEALTRPRTRTLDDMRSSVPASAAHTPPHMLSRRHRMGSVNLPTPTSLDTSEGAAGYGAGTLTRRSSAPVVEGVQLSSTSADGTYYGSPTSATATATAASAATEGRNSQAKRILHLMRTLQGRMNGTVALRRHAEAQWTTISCYIHEEAGALLYEPQRYGSNIGSSSVIGAGMGNGTTSERAPRTLLADLRGCAVRPRMDGEVPYLAIGVGVNGDGNAIPNGSGSGGTANRADSAAMTHELHLRPPSQAEFDAWYAAFLYWLDPDQVRSASPADEAVTSMLDARTTASATAPPRPLSEHVVMEPVLETAQRPPLPPRTSSRGQSQEARAVEGTTATAAAPTTTTTATTMTTSKSDRRKSIVSSLKEAPVIKIGKMIYWESTVESGPAHVVNSSNTTGSGRPPNRRAQSTRSRKWRRISGQLRENGELKLHSDADNSLMSVVQLSQLSRCAIQRLDPSVLEVSHCIAIYPQYTSDPPDTQGHAIRPIFLSLESRVLFEVWFVLLRAFAIPQLYGSSRYVGDVAGVGEDGQVLEDSVAMSTMDMFRMERTLHLRVIEAKMYPLVNGNGIDQGSVSGGLSKSVAAKADHQHGYYAEVLLDSATRGKTIVKFEGLAPLWAESFEFLDLPPVLNSASVVVKRRPVSEHHPSDRTSNQLVHPADQQGGFTGFTSDVACGKVEIYLEELEEGREMEKWWPLLNSAQQRVGEVLIRAQAEEGVILMARDYEPLAELLHRFSNGLTMQIVQLVPNELKRVSDCLLNIFQVSGRANDWLMSLIEEEIDGIHKEALGTRLRFTRRAGSDANTDAAPGSSSGPTSAGAAAGGLAGGVAGATAAAGATGSNSEREMIVRDMNRNATVEANLLFRGNTLLTKALDTHMRRVGKEYLEASLAAKLKEINDRDPDCEVDPNRVPNQQDLDRNWRRLLLFTQEIWTAISNARKGCPNELRLLFRHIRYCAEDRYGDFLRSVRFSSVSGFLFLRFFCPAILNPSLFGLLNDEIRPKARRTFVLIAKSLQTLANLASFGTKETWMEPMNAFLTQHRESFKSFINDVCDAPPPVKAPAQPDAPGQYSGNVVSADTHLSYTTPMTIMQRLPPTSREGFPSLPYLIDQARAYAELVQVWLESVSKFSRPSGDADEPEYPAYSSPQTIAAIKAVEGDLLDFHEICISLHERTQECLSRAERAERPSSAASFHWDDMLDQLHPGGSLADEVHDDGNSDDDDNDDDDDDADDSKDVHRPFDKLAERIASDSTLLSSSRTSNSVPLVQRPGTGTSDFRDTWRPQTADSSSDYASYTDAPVYPHQSTGPQNQQQYQQSQQQQQHASSALELLNQIVRERPWSAGRSAAVLRDSLRKAARSHSRGSAGRAASPGAVAAVARYQLGRPASAAASASNISTGNLSSAPSSDTERPAGAVGGRNGGGASKTSKKMKKNSNKKTMARDATTNAASAVAPPTNNSATALPDYDEFARRNNNDTRLLRAQRREAMVVGSDGADGTGGGFTSAIPPNGSVGSAAPNATAPGAVRGATVGKLGGGKKKTPIVSALRKTRQKEHVLLQQQQQQQAQQQQRQEREMEAAGSKGGSGAAAAGKGAWNGRTVRGVDMSFV